MPSDPIVLACACDERFAPGLAVTIRSLLDTKTDPRPVLLFVLVHKLSDATKERLRRSWEGNIEVRFLTPPVDRILQCNLRNNVSPAIYFRILIAECVSSDRAIYLDSDMLVQSDIAALWDTDLAGAPLAAVQDLGNPTVSEAGYGLPNYQALGLPAAQPYINSGLLLLDLALWRKEKLSKHILDYSIRERDHVLFWDQDGINAIIGSRAKLLDAKWNAGVEALQRFCTWKANTEWKRNTVAHIGNDPWIVHFLLLKPWEVRLDHPYAPLFDSVLDRTDWKGHRAT